MFIPDYQLTSGRVIARTVGMKHISLTISDSLINLLILIIIGLVVLTA
ncbi:MAG: hypothetical protein ACE5D0_05655 [Fidelibacterota bacterium]